MKKSETSRKTILNQKSFFKIKGDQEFIWFLAYFNENFKVDGGSEGDRTPVQKQNPYSLYTLSKSENFI